MQHTLPRRRFLKTAAAVVAGPKFSAALLGNGSGDVPDVSKRPRLRVGCCAYSYSKYLKSGQMTMEDFILKAVELGVDGVDVTTYWLKSTDPAYLLQFRNFAYRHAMPFTGAAIGTNMCLPESSKRAEELEKIKQWVDRTELLGAAHLRVFGGAVPEGATEDQAIGWVVEVMKPASDYAAKKGVILGIESHGGITSKAANILEILKRVDSPYAQCNLDIANFPENPYPQIEACIPFASHTHIRDYYGERKEPLDLERVWKLFAMAGYKGYMSAEYEAEEDAMTGVPKLIAKIKALCQKYSTA
jgi:sugar phosphate isomerase/epimerase